MLGSASAVGEVNAGLVVEVCPSTAVVLGLVSAVVKVGPEVEVCSTTAVASGSVSAVGEVKIGSQVGIGRSLVVIKGNSLSLASPLDLFE